MLIAEKLSRHKLEVLKTKVFHVRGIIVWACHFFIQKVNADR